MEDKLTPQNLGDAIREVALSTAEANSVDLSLVRTVQRQSLMEAKLEEKAPKLAGGKWDLDGKTFANEGAAIKAAIGESMRGGGKTIKIWEKPDAIRGISGNKGYSVSVKSISRKRQLA